VQKLKEIQPKINSPPVGHYDVNSDYVLTKAESTFNILKRTSNFIDPLNCKRVKVDLYDPFKHIEDDKQKLPGPGSYNNVISLADTTVKKINLSNNRYKMKKKNNESKIMHLRSKQRLLNNTPGPGAYIDPIDKSKYMIAPVSNSMFKSDSLRDMYGLGQRRGPGPAFYKVKEQALPKSYNYNPKQKWL
jgi:hypothetical protein